jgi:hypothetical protein
MSVVLVGSVRITEGEEPGRGGVLVQSGGERDKGFQIDTAGAVLDGGFLGE